MNICIICRKEKEEELSIEHVIPQAIGGYYKIKNVCGICNSEMGLKIDVGLVNNFFSDLMRYKNKIPGKTGKIPTPFAGIYDDQNNENIKVCLDYTKDNELSHKILPIPKTTTDSEGKPIIITMKYDLNDIESAQAIIDKTLKRNGISKDKISIVKKEETINPIHITHDISINWGSIAIGLLKIAYEFSVDMIPEYYYSLEAIEISGILREMNIVKAVNMISEINIVNKPNNSLGLISNAHYLSLININEQLICHIRLEELFEVVFVMANSNKYIDKSCIIGINNYKNGTFEFNKSPYEPTPTRSDT